MAQAVPYWQQAGQRAIERSANLEAISHLTRGLELLKTLPDTPERAQQELDAADRPGPALMATKGYAAPEVEHAYARARELCQQLGDSPQLFPVLRGLWQYYLVRAELQTARELAEEFLSLAQHQQDPALLLEAHRALGTTLFYAGRAGPRPARTWSRRSPSTTPSSTAPIAFLYGQDPGVLSGLAAWDPMVAGLSRPGPAEEPRGAHPGPELAHPFSLAYALDCCCHVHQFRREVQAAQERAEAAIALCRQSRGSRTSWPWGTILRGWALAEQGQGEEGMAQIARAGRRAGHGGELGMVVFSGPAGRGVWKSGAGRRGAARRGRGAGGVDNTGERFYEAELYRLKGELLLQQCRPARAPQAEACFHQALAVARRQQAKSLELRAAMSLSRLWQQQGKRAEAHELLAAIYGWFTEGFDTADLQEARALLEELT